MDLIQPAVSIVIPCYNDGLLLLEALASVSKCIPATYEVIIVNDGSTDEQTLQILENAKKSGHQVLHLSNGGLGRARNHGVKHSKGRYILPLDADNRLRPEYLLVGIDCLDKNPEIGVVYGDYEYFGDKQGIKRVPDFSRSRLLSYNFIDACALYRKSCWEDAGGYDEKMPSQGHEDWDLWCRMSVAGVQFHHVQQIMFDYRVRKESMSRTMLDPSRMSQTLQYIRGKNIQISISDYLSAYRCTDYIVEQIKMRPIKNSILFFLDVFFPNFAKKRKGRNI